MREADIKHYYRRKGYRKCSICKLYLKRLVNRNCATCVAKVDNMSVVSSVRDLKRELDETRQLLADVSHVLKEIGVDVPCHCSKHKPLYLDKWDDRRVEKTPKTQKTKQIK